MVVLNSSGRKVPAMQYLNVKKKGESTDKKIFEEKMKMIKYWKDVDILDIELRMGNMSKASWY